MASTKLVWPKSKPDSRNKRDSSAFDDRFHLCRFGTDSCSTLAGEILWNFFDRKGRAGRLEPGSERIS
jgi:hypothetical protein